MIDLILKFGTEVIQVRIQDGNIFFRTSQFTQFADIAGIKLNKVGVIKEFPDLKDKKDWQEIARQRFKEKISKMKTERERANYIIKDLEKYGYVPLYERRDGFRPKKF